MGAGDSAEYPDAGAAWTVRPGDNLWSISESVLQDRLGRRPSEAETASYWLRMIAVNRPRLPDPQNPGLIFAGESIVLPPI
jgi:nucleoid-associated protein YgaU